MVNPYHFQPDSRCWELIDVTLTVEDTDSEFVDAVVNVGIYNSQADERLREPEREPDWVRVSHNVREWSRERARVSESETANCSCTLENVGIDYNDF